jgi:DNA-binding CsgD family transcriptional regulator
VNQNGRRGQIGVGVVDSMLDFVLQLYRLAQCTPVAEFHDLALNLAKQVVPFGHAHNLMLTDDDDRHRISCYRSGGTDHFSARDCARANALLPHFVEALALNRSLAVRAPSDSTPPTSTRALIDASGVLLHSSREFLEILRMQWQDWEEPRIPDTLLSRLRSGPAHIAGGDVCITTHPVGEALLLTARRVSRLDRLSPREATVAREFGSGKTYKEIAKALQRSPATIRNMLQSAYRKLGIDNKAELVRLLHLERD